jgi:RecB family exonuclease
MCPQQYKLKVGTRQFSNTVTPSLSFGNSIHSALEEIHTSLPSKQMFDCQQILRHHWKAKDYGDARESELYFERGLEALSRYMEVMGQFVDRIIGTEIYLSRIVRLDGIRVRLGCKVDRLELHPDRVLEALDYKTNAGGQVPTPEFLANDLATFIYYVLVRISYPKLSRVIVSQLNVLTLSKVEVSYDSTKITENKQALVRLAQAIRAGEFDPRPGTMCSWCRVRDYCPAFEPDSDLDSLV